MAQSPSDTKTDVPVSPRALHILDWIKKTPEEIEAKFTVDCDTCPVSMQCQAGEGGSERYCEHCSSTGVPVDADEMTKTTNVYIVDCDKHGFTRKVKGGVCCNGTIMDLATREPPLKPLVYILHTKHSKVPVAERLAFWNGKYSEYQRARKKATAK